MRGRMNRTDHLRVKPQGKTIHLKKERNAVIEHDNRLLFKKIEAIINRQGPYKKQPSLHNQRKLTKVFHAPSDNTITAAKYFERPSYSIDTVKREQRQVASDKLQAENLKVLDRIRSSKPTIKMEELRRFERTAKSRSKMLKN